MSAAEWEPPKTGRCPGCGETRPLVTVMWLTEKYTELGHVCELCRRKWLKRMKAQVGMK